MKRVAVVGVYGTGPDFTTGQAVKCFELICWFRARYGDAAVKVVNTHQWKRRPIGLFLAWIRAFCEGEQIILMPAQHGVRVFAPMAYLLKKRFRKPVHYVVIGGWLAELLTAKPWLKRCVASFDGVYVETQAMVEKLRAIGLTNVVYLPNFRSLPLKRPEKRNVWDEPARVCVYSRIIKAKGIQDAVSIVREANRRIGRPRFTLDVYGKVDPAFQAEFDELLRKNADIVGYLGVKNADEGAEVLESYFALLFPSYYEGEGFPGTILDAFAACTPVIANDWKDIREIIKSGENGLIYPFRDINAAAALLCQLYEDRALYAHIRSGCWGSAMRCATDVVLAKLDEAMWGKAK